MSVTRQMLISILLAVILFGGMRMAGNTTASAQKGNPMMYFHELVEQSQKEKKGLTFYIKGQTIAGVVVKVMEPNAVEVRNQTFSKIVIRLDHVDAVAIN
ncbi:MAG: hypothetical protein JST85_01455 [Acidobacteria bacterium]|nr:hypothetical protein [Acidobacteriota bacterium]